jgi:exonuclease SbcC
MKIKTLELRGAIGILKGLGIDEIKINLDKYDEGLIAIIGQNGSGKTTIMENMHPFRRLVSRKSSLADHFALKDSYRKLTFEIGKDEYRAEIYIDGVTKKSEAYLFKNGTPLNDGKATTYDEEVHNLLGSEDLFFNSVFSAQMSESLAKLTATERRELFYELLGLNKYENYLEQVKNKIKEVEAGISKLQGVKETLAGNMKDIGALEREKEQISALIQEIKKEIVKIDERILSLEKEIEELRIKEIQAQNQISEIENLKQKKLQLEKAIAEAENKIKDTIKNLQEEAIRKAEIISKRYLDKKQELQGKVQENYATLMELKRSSSIEERDIQDLRTEIATKKPLLIKLQDEISSIHVGDLGALTEKQTELNKEFMKIQTGLLDLERQQNNEMDKVNTEAIKVHTLDLNIQTLQNDLEKLNNELKQAEDKLNADTQRIKDEGDMIGNLPCSSLEDFDNQVCPFLKRAYEVWNNQETIIGTTKSWINNIQAKIEFKAEMMAGKITEKKTLQEELEAKAIEIVKRTERSKGELTSQMDKLKIQMKELEYLIREAKSKDEAYKKLRAQIDEIERELATKEAVLKHKESSMNEKQESLKSQAGKIEKEISNIEKELQNLQEKELDEITRMKEDTIQAISMIKEIQEAPIKNAEEELKIINEKINNNKVTLELIKISDLINGYKQKLEGAKQGSKLAQESLQKLNLQQERILTEINLVNEVKTKIEYTENEIKTLQDEYKSYMFLARAFDKTGIPVLKLESTSKEITAIANDLLNYFNSNFRVAFETIRPSKDGKKLKEVFDINVIDDEGVTALENKSGGEQVWVDTAIRLAISLLLRSQGKRLETFFLDERDGAFDIENALNYVKMIETAHKQSGACYTLVVTHRKELQNIIEQQINLKAMNGGR